MIKTNNIFTASFILVFTFLHFNTNAQSVLNSGGITANITQTNSTTIGNKFFVHAGLAFNSSSVSSPNPSITGTNFTNLNLGVSYQFKMGETINFEPGIFYTPVGTGIISDFLKIAANFNYPINKIDIVAGPTISIPLSSGLKTPFGLNIGLGYNLNKFKISAIYNIGFSNFSEGTGTKTATSNYPPYIYTETYDINLKLSSFNLIFAYNF